MRRLVRNAQWNPGPCKITNMTLGLLASRSSNVICCASTSSPLPSCQSTQVRIEKRHSESIPPYTWSHNRMVHAASLSASGGNVHHVLSREFDSRSSAFIITELRHGLRRMYHQVTHQQQVDVMGTIYIAREAGFSYIHLLSGVIL